MTTRRQFLAAAAFGAIGASGVGCFVPGSPIRRPLKKLGAHACTPSLPSGADWGADLRARFQYLRCLVSTLQSSTSPAPPLEAEATRAFLSLHSALAYYDYDRAVAESWRLFYGLTAVLHDHRNTRASRAKIPVYAHNGHHHAARIWLEEGTRRPLGPLVHFDSHHDQWAVERPNDILAAITQLRAGGRHRAEGSRTLKRLIDDHRTPVSIGALGLPAKELVWCHPYWSGVPEIHRRTFLYAEVKRPGGHTGVYRLLHDAEARGSTPLPKYNSAPWVETASLGRSVRLRHRRAVQMSYVQTGCKSGQVMSGARWKALLKTVPRGRYLLDIDSDYFLTVDLKSGFERSRCRSLSRDERRRDQEDDERCLKSYEEQLKQARRLVDERLRRFRRLLEKLRDAGRIPSLITIADSTYQPFATSPSGEGFWEYMPYEFAAYVHWELRRLLDRVFVNLGIEAGV